MESRQFFGLEGLTSTSAAHIAELSRQHVRGLKAYLDSTSFITESIKLIGSDSESVVKKGMTNLDIDFIWDSLNGICAHNALTAYLMEAVKEKENLTKAAKEFSFTDKRRVINAKKAACEANKPKLAPSITRESIINSWSVGQLEHYLTLQAQAAAIGKYIHEDGALDNARKKMDHVYANPIETNGSGAEMVIRTKSLSVEVDAVEHMYFELQKWHREVQAELNGMEKTISDAIEKSEMERMQNYNLAMRAYNEEIEAISRESLELDREEALERMNRLKEIQNMKIVIPNNLRETYEKLSK